MLYVMLGALLLVTLFLAAPISVGYDSRQNRLQVTWLGLTFTPGPRAKKRRKIEKVRPREKKIPAPALMRLLLQERSLFLELLEKSVSLGLNFLRRLSFRESILSVCLPDPMWNGLLFAAVANMRLEEVDLTVNFKHFNYAKILVTCYPYRMAPPLAGFLFRLPYGRLLRVSWKLKKLKQSIRTGA